MRNCKSGRGAFYIKVEERLKRLLDEIEVIMPV